MDEDVALELASQQVIKYLLSSQQFIEKWQTEVKKNLDKEDLEDVRKPSTSSSSSNINKPLDPAITTIQTAVLELTNNIQYVIEVFEDNVDPRHCFLSPNQGPNRDANFLYDTGQKVEKLKNLVMEDREKRKDIGESIAKACRRMKEDLNRFGKKFQGQPSLEIRGLLPVIHQFCRLFYTIAQEIQRFSGTFRSKNSRKIMKNVGRNLENSANEFNLKIAAEAEKIVENLKKAATKQAPPTLRQKTPPPQEPYGIRTRSQHRMASSIQQTIRRREQNSEDVDVINKRFRRPHPPGGIATSIIPKTRGYLLPDNLLKARERYQKPAKKINLNIDKKSPEDTDDVIMKSARKMTELVLEDMRKSINF